MDMWSHLVALVLALAGSASLYATTNRQRWRAPPWSNRVGRLIGAALLMAAWASWCAALAPSTALFAVLTVVQLALALLPAIASGKKPT